VLGICTVGQTERRQKTFIPATDQLTAVHHCKLVGWLEFNVPFQQKYGYIRDKRSGVESYPYPVKEGQRYINLNPGRLFVQQPPKKGKGSRGSFKLLS